MHARLLEGEQLGAVMAVAIVLTFSISGASEAQPGVGKEAVVPRGPGRTLKSLPPLLIAGSSFSVQWMTAEDAAGSELSPPVSVGEHLPLVLSRCMLETGQSFGITFLC